MTTLPLTEHKRNVIRAWLDGKTIQAIHDDGWRDWTHNVCMMFDGDDDHYRIKPTPTRRFWRPEEIPVGWQSRLIDGRNNGVITGITGSGHAYSSAGQNIWPSTFMNYEVAPPGPANQVQWQPAGVEE